MTAMEIEKNNGKNLATNSCRPTSVVRKFMPAIDVFEQSDAIILVADVPGATPDSVNVEFERGTLTFTAAVRGRQDEANTKFLLREYGVGHYQRTLEINEQVEADKIEAKLDNGVLTITLPKAEQVRPRKIAVKSV